MNDHMPNQRFIREREAIARRTRHDGVFARYALRGTQPKNFLAAFTRRARYIFGAAAVLSFIAFLMLSLPIHAYSSKILGWLVVQVAAFAWLRWTAESGPPVLPIILSFYAIYFAMPMFYIESISRLHSIFPVQEPLTREVMGMVLLTQLSIVAGWELARRKPLQRPRLALEVTDGRLQALAFIIIAVQVVILYFTVFRQGFELGSAAQIVNGLFNPYLAVGILYHLSERNGWTFARSTGLAAIFLSFIASSVSTTMLGEMILPFIVIGMLTLRRHVVKTLTAGLILATLGVVLQPTKLEYRARLIQLEETGRRLSLEEKAFLYYTLTVAYWSGERIEKFYDESASLQAGKRFALLPILEIIAYDTPGTIPFQMGKTLEFILYTPIPRFLYPEKPTAQEANVWFAQAYGLIDVGIAKRTMVGISHLGEVFVNFGYVGIPIAFFLVGIGILRFARIAAFPGSSVARKALFVAIIPQFLSIESTLTGFIVGLIYSTLFAFLSLVIAQVRISGRPSTGG